MTTPCTHQFRNYRSAGKGRAVLYCLDCPHQETISMQAAFEKLTRELPPERTDKQAD